jgi:acyl carrier protein
MGKTEFVSRLAEFCHFENQDLKLDTKLNSIEEYDSMAMLSVIAFVYKNFKINLTASQLQNLTDFNSIISLIGEDKFAEN